MNPLSQETCTPCRRGAVGLTPAEVAALLPQLPRWEHIEIEGIPQLQRRFPFKTYLQGLKFVHQVAHLAEDNHHHPVLVLEWAQVTVRWWTHTLGGLHRNDFILAARCDDLYREFLRPHFV